MAVVKIDNVKKIYPNGAVAVQGVSLEIANGEFVVLVGPSGCGKSTMLRMVAGLEDISEGVVSIGERVVNDVDPADRDIAMVFQNYALYPHMTVYKNMAYGLKNRGVSKVEIDAAVQKAAKTLNLSEYIDRRPSQLSGGQRQRVAMGRAIVRNPALFLFDEPLSNLDAKLRNQMRIEIRKLQKALGTTSIYVTHDQVEAMTMADRIVVMNGGRIEQIGTPSDIYHHPESTFVASFMGAPPMNMVSGRLDSQGIEIEGIGYINAPMQSEQERPVSVGVRPEQVHLTDTPNGITQPFEVEYVEELGAARMVHGRIGASPFIVNMTHDTDLPTGAVHAAIRPESLHVFDAATGRRIEQA